MDNAIHTDERHPVEKYLIAGLGNPGADYEHTRHNAGFDTLDLIAEKLSARYWKSECGALCAHTEYNGCEVLLAKPQSFMNVSGGPVSCLAEKYTIPADHIIVIHDELDIQPGTIRVKFGGGLAGHNGLKSIADKLKTKDWARIRVGIGRPPGRMSVTDFVLRSPKGEEMEDFLQAQELGAQAALSYIDDGLVKTQGKFN